MATSSVCSCFGNLRPRYKRLVDKVFPSDPHQGLVKSNMEKLTFYVLSAPEKLDRIGDYLFSKLNNHVYRKRTGLVFIAIEAMDHLLLACRSSSLNLFVESFLKMVHALLETSEPELQIAGTCSFIKFSNIEEDTPSYHRRYDFFVSKFSHMCWNSNSNEQLQKRIKLSGIYGLQGVVRKTVKDDLQANIWDDTHMTKIIPSLLYNVKSGSGKESRSTASISIAGANPTENTPEDPAVVAEVCLRELISRASFGNISAALQPVLEYLDSNGLWVPNDFAIYCFWIIMYSIQSQYSYKAIEILLRHLDAKGQSCSSMKASIVEVISQSVGIATGGSIGSSVLEVFNTLIRHLRLSIDACSILKDQEKIDGEKVFQEAVVATAGAFSSTLPDYQRSEVMTFIIGKIPNLLTVESRRESIVSDYEQGFARDARLHHEDVLQLGLFKCLQKVAEVHTSENLAATFPISLLDPLLKSTVRLHPEARISAQKIFQTLLNRDNNLSKVEELCCNDHLPAIDFKIGQCSKQDKAFLRKNLQLLFYHFQSSLKLTSNTSAHYKSLCIVFCLLALDVGLDDILVELVRFIINLQDLAMNSSSKFNEFQSCGLNAIVAVFYATVASILKCEDARLHLNEVIQARKVNRPQWLPEVAFTGHWPKDKHLKISNAESLHFNHHQLCESLSHCGLDTSSIEIPFEAPRSTVVRAASAASLPDVIPIVKSDSRTNVCTVTSNTNTKDSAVLIFEDLKKSLRLKDNKPKMAINYEQASFEEVINHSNKVAAESRQMSNRVWDIACRSAELSIRDENEHDVFSLKFPGFYVH